jgi:hypothetical protein
MPLTLIIFAHVPVQLSVWTLVGASLVLIHTLKRPTASL